MKNPNESAAGLRAKTSPFRSCVWFLLLLLSAVPCFHAATITIINLDGVGEGFNDTTPAIPVGGNPGTTVGQQRLNVFQRAADLLGPELQSTVVIRMAASFDPLSCTPTTGVLGSAGPTTVHRDFPGAPVANTLYVSASASSRTGTDINGATDDIVAQFNSNVGQPGCLATLSWYYGLDGNEPANSIDLLSTILHETCHGLGFLSLVNLTTGAKFNGFDDAYMRLLENHNNGLLYPAMTAAQRVTASKAGTALHWVGANVIARSAILTAGRDATHVQMYAPNPAQPGSSVSHFSNALLPDELMEPFATPNFSRVLTSALLADTGWRIRPVTTTTLAPVNFTENAAAMIVDPGITVTDGDSANLNGATISITAGFQSSVDLLDCSPPAGITKSYAPATGILTLSGVSTVANYQTALRAVTFRNPSDNPTANTRTIRFVSSDDVGNGLASSRDVIVIPVNDAPTLTTVSTLTGAAESAPFTISYATLAAAANEADVEGNAISFRVEAVSSGSLSVLPGTYLSAGGNWVWTPPADTLGTLNAFTIKAWDGALASATPIQVTVSVVPGPGSLDLTFNPGSGANGTIYAIAVTSDSKILIGGDFTQMNGVAAPHLVMLSSGGSISSYWPAPNWGPDGPVFSIAAHEYSYYPLFDKIVVGGLFSSVAGNYIYSLATLVYGGTVYELETPYLDAILNTGPPTYFVPAAVRSVALNGSDILAGGEFTYIDATRGVNRIGKWFADGQYYQSVCCYGGANATVRAVAVRSMDNWFFVGGDFQSIGAVNRNYFALLNLNGEADLAFAPSFNNSVYSITPYGITQPDYGDILVSGTFSTVNGVNRSRIARLNANGTVDTGFATTAGPNGNVYATAFDSTGLPLIGGSFTAVDGTTRNRIARLTAAGALDTTFAPGTGANGDVRAIAVQSDGKILIVGSFTTYNGVPRNGIARLLKQ